MISSVSTATPQTRFGGGLLQKARGAASQAADIGKTLVFYDADRYNSQEAKLFAAYQASGQSLLPQDMGYTAFLRSDYATTGRMKKLDLTEGKPKGVTFPEYVSGLTKAEKAAILAG